MKKISFIFPFLFLIVHGFAQQELALYDAEVPNSKPSANKERSSVRANGMLMIEAVQIPAITVYVPPKGMANGTAVIICPGGGYSILSAGHEGIEIAKEFNKWGVTAFVLKYRLPDDRWMVDRSMGPLQDGQRAFQLVRKNAAKWNIDTSRIGVMGFSAGGHLASSIATHFHEPLIDNPDRINLRPDFQVLIYPVITFTDSFGHTDSRTKLIGDQPSIQMIKRFSGEMNIGNDSPPAFLVHAADDKVVRVENSLRYAEALVVKSIPVELHVYEKGGHGFGMNNSTTRDKWMERLYNWMQARKWVK
jgi:acetyl esterase/lipase